MTASVAVRLAPMHGEVRAGRVWNSVLEVWEPIHVGKVAKPPLTQKQKQRLRARSLGLCAVCCSREPSPDLKTCDICRRRRKKTYLELQRLAGLAKKAGLG